MSILITNDEFPQSCWDCPCCSIQDNGFAGWEHYCNLLDEFVNDFQHSHHKLCPLVEVPTPHGRLVDLDKLIDDMGLDKAKKYGNETAVDRNFSYGTLMRYEIADILEDAPVIIDKE